MNIRLKFKIFLCLFIISIISYIIIIQDDYIIVEPPILIDQKNLSFLSSKVSSTKISNFCKFEKKGWRTKNIQFGHYNILFNLLEDNDIVSGHIFRHSTWETGIINTILHVLNKTTLKLGYNVSFLDIGANIGYFTTIIAKHGYNTISFEPMNENIDILSRNLCDNNVDPIVFHTALGDKEDTCWVISGYINKGDGIIVCDKKPKNIFKGSDNHLYMLRHEINVNLLDNYLNFDNNYPRIAVVKIDVEGFEEKVLNGGLQWLKNFPPYYIFMEFFLSNKPEFIHFLYELGYIMANWNCENPVLLENDVPSFFKLNPTVRDVCFINKKLSESFLSTFFFRHVPNIFLLTYKNRFFFHILTRAYFYMKKLYQKTFTQKNFSHVSGSNFLTVNFFAQKKKIFFFLAKGGQISYFSGGICRDFENRGTKL